MQKDLGANVERETLRLTAKQDAEKIELLAEVGKNPQNSKQMFRLNINIVQVKAVCGQLEVNVTEQMQRSSNELQTLDYRSQLFPSHQHSPFPSHIMAGRILL